MPMTFCKECDGKVSDTAATCPHCGAPVAAPAANYVSSAPEMPPPVKEKSTWWMWVIGVPIGLFILMMIIGSLNSNPEKSRARDVYSLCMSDLESAKRGMSSTQSFIAGTCESLRNDFIKKYNASP
jgi:hypothetical protein